MHGVFGVFLSTAWALLYRCSLSELIITTHRSLSSSARARPSSGSWRGKANLEPLFAAMCPGLCFCRGGIGKHVEYNASASREQLESHRALKNRKLIDSLKEDTQFSQHLMDACNNDVELGRMDPARLASSLHMDLGSATFSPRFGVEQGEFACDARDLLCVRAPPAFCVYQV